jgi:hypothetical protein
MVRARQRCMFEATAKCLSAQLDLGGPQRCPPKIWRNSCERNLDRFMLSVRMKKRSNRPTNFLPRRRSGELPRGMNHTRRLRGSDSRRRHERLSQTHGALASKRVSPTDGGVKTATHQEATDEVSSALLARAHHLTQRFELGCSLSVTGLRNEKSPNFNRPL